MTEPMRENERIAKRIIDTSADGDNSPRYNWAEAELIKALDSKDSLIQAKEERIKELEKDVKDWKAQAKSVAIECADKVAYNRELRTLVKELGKALTNLIEAEECSFDHHGYCQSHGVSKPCNNEAAKQALLLIPEELRKS